METLVSIICFVQQFCMFPKQFRMFPQCVYNDIAQFVIVSQAEGRSTTDILTELYVLCKGFYRAIFVDIVFLWRKHCEIAGGGMTILTVLPAGRIVLLEQLFHSFQKFLHMVLAHNQVATIVCEKDISHQVLNFLRCFLSELYNTIGRLYTRIVN